MLKRVEKGPIRSTRGSFAIVASRYNGKYVDAMLRAARAELKRAGAKSIKILRVPGAFEIPAVAARLAANAPRSTLHAPYDAIICFGVIFQGQTSHAQHIGWGVTHALAQIQIQHRLPIIHAVFVFEKEDHARVRCLGKKHNRGTEAARTAIQMARLMKEIPDDRTTESTR
jgi:6,7-dimethyl-8-ribityllumazine synthase